MDDEGSEDETIDAASSLNSDIGVNTKEDFGEDFDDFEAGAMDEEFGDFDEGFQEPSLSGHHVPGPQKSTDSSQAPSSTFPFVSRSVGYPKSCLRSCISLSKHLNVADY